MVIADARCAGPDTLRSGFAPRAIVIARFCIGPLLCVRRPACGRPCGRPAALAGARSELSRRSESSRCLSALETPANGLSIAPAAWRRKRGRRSAPPPVGAFSPSPAAAASRAASSGFLWPSSANRLCTNASADVSMNCCKSSSMVSRFFARKSVTV